MINQPPYLPFADGQWRMNLNLKALDPQSWIEIDQNFAEQLALKEKLLQTQYSDVFASLTETQPSQKEVLDLLLNHLLKYFPQHYQYHNQIIKNITTGQVWYLSNFESVPLDLAGRLVQEDLLLMQSTPQGYTLAAASLCFPLRWRLQEKLGCPLTEIHSPVPGYEEKLAHPVDNFFSRLKSNYPAWRLNWSIVNSPELFLPPQQENPDWHITINAGNAGERLWIRVERQTVRRLKVSRDILFTIRTYVYPLRVLENNPTLAKNLVQILKQMPTDMQNYKKLLPIRQTLLDYLEVL